MKAADYIIIAAVGILFVIAFIIYRKKPGCCSGSRCSSCSGSCSDCSACCHRCSAHDKGKVKDQAKEQING